MSSVYLDRAINSLDGRNGHGERACDERIFVVDDDPPVRMALSLVLSSEGFEVTSFVEGEAFLAAARRGGRGH